MTAAQNEGMGGSPISAEEKLRGRECVDSALGSGAIDGSFCDEETIALFNRFVDGEFTQEELWVAINLHAVDLLTAMGYAVPPHLISK